MNNSKKNIGMQEDEIEIDLADLFSELKHHWVALFAGLIVGIILAAVITVFCMKPIYRSTSMIYMRGNGSTIASLTDLQIGSELTNDYSVIFTSRTLLTQAIKELNLDMEYEELKSMIKISNPSDTRILEVSVENQNASLACDIANKVVTLGAETANEIDSKEPYLIDKAVIAEHPVSPSLYKNIIIGGVLGVILVGAALVIRYVLNDALQTSQDVERYLDLPVLCEIPESHACEYERADKKHKSINGRKKH